MTRENMKRFLSILANVMSKHSELIAGVLTIIAVVLGFFLSRATVTVSDANGDIEVLQQDNAALREKLNISDGTISTLEQSSSEQATELEEANAEIDRLNDLLGNGPIESGAPSVRNQVVGLPVATDAMDLNSSEPQWGIGQADDYAVNTLNYYGDGGIEFAYVDLGALNSDQTGNYATCSTLTTYEVGLTALEVSDLEGIDYCVRLDNDRFGTFTITDFDEQTVTLDVTTWEFE